MCVYINGMKRDIRTRGVNSLDMLYDCYRYEC